MANPDSLTKDLIDVPSQWRLAMMLTENALEVVINSPIQDNALIYRSLPLDKGMNTLDAFEDLIYDNPLLLADFNKVDLLIDNSYFTFLPTELANQQAMDDSIQALWPEIELTPLPNKINGTSDTLVMGINPAILSFVQRTFLDTEPLHPISVLANYFLPLSRQGNTAKLYAHLGADKVDVIVIDYFKNNLADSSPLRLATSFSAASPEDAAYFILAAAKQSELNLSADEIRLSGNPQRREEVSAILRQVATYVMPVIFPSEIFRSGKEAIDAPFPLILLPLSI